MEAEPVTLETQEDRPLEDNLENTEGTPTEGENANNEEGEAVGDEATSQQEVVALPEVPKVNPLLMLKDAYITPSVLIPEDMEVTKAKSYLKSQNVEGKGNLYDHLVSVIMNVLDTRPSDGLDQFERISVETKLKTFQSSARQLFKVKFYLLCVLITFKSLSE